MKRIVVGIDGSQTARQALHWALEEARAHGAAVDVVHVWQAPYLGGYPYVAAVEVDPAVFAEAGQRLLDEAVDAADTDGVAVERVLAEGSPAQTIVDAAKGADLVVVGSRGRGGFAGLLLGSVSQQVVHHATCPVVVVPPAEER